MKWNELENKLEQEKIRVEQKTKEVGRGGL